MIYLINTKRVTTASTWRAHSHLGFGEGKTHEIILLVALSLLLFLPFLVCKRKRIDQYRDTEGGRERDRDKGNLGGKRGKKKGNYIKKSKMMLWINKARETRAVNIMKAKAVCVPLPPKNYIYIYIYIYARTYTCINVIMCMNALSLRSNATSLSWTSSGRSENSARSSFIREPRAILALAYNIPRKSTAERGTNGGLKTGSKSTHA